jgi:3',5'-cyclic AMP phosphodiesterase CpdA
MLLAQITDLHVSLPGTRADDVFRTAERLEAWVRRLNALDLRPDVVLATGDLVNDHSAPEYERLAGLLAPLAMPLYLIPGNHDDRAALAAAFPAHDYLAADGGFHNYVIEDYPLRLVAVDTLKPGEIGGEFCEARRDWLARRLAEAPAQPTLILMHHPPFRSGLPKMDRLGLEGMDRFVETIRGFDNIERVIAGHLHRPIFRQLANTVVSTAPATAHQIAYEFGTEGRPTMTAEPPACHMHLWLGAEEGLVTHTIYLEDEHYARD